MQLPITISIDRMPLLARLLCRGDIVALTLLADGRIEAERRDGSLDMAQVEPGTTLFSNLVILRLRVAGRVESLVLPHAATGAAAHRQLRVWLRWRALTGAASGAA